VVCRPGPPTRARPDLASWRQPSPPPGLGHGRFGASRPGWTRHAFQPDAATPNRSAHRRGQSVLRVRLVERTPHEPLDEHSNEGSDGGVVELAMEATDPALQVGSGDPILRIESSKPTDDLGDALVVQRPVLRRFGLGVNGPHRSWLAVLGRGWRDRCGYRHDCHCLSWKSSIIPRVAVERRPDQPGQAASHSASPPHSHLSRTAQHQ
jgi:hypothetical protein